MELPSRCVRLDLFKDERQDLNEKLRRAKNSLNVGMLDAATPANISICLSSVRFFSSKTSSGNGTSYAQSIT